MLTEEDEAKKEVISRLHMEHPKTGHAVEVDGFY